MHIRTYDVRAKLFENGAITIDFGLILRTTFTTDARRWYESGCSLQADGDRRGLTVRSRSGARRKV